MEALLSPQTDASTWPYHSKENQVYSAEEKAALAMFNFEENKRKEAKVLEDMKKLVDRTLGGEEEETK